MGRGWKADAGVSPARRRSAQLSVTPFLLSDFVAETESYSTSPTSAGTLMLLYFIDFCHGTPGI
jgi:hypothetical protein